MWRFIVDLSRSEAEVEMKSIKLHAYFGERSLLNAFETVFGVTTKDSFLHLHQNQDL